MIPDSLHVDDSGFPHIYLGAGEEGPTHDVVLERTHPVVEGFCVTCCAAHDDELRAERRARACPLAVAYLSVVNRDRRMRQHLVLLVEAESRAS